MLVLHEDGFTNIVNQLTGLGTEYDSNATTQLINQGYLTKEYLENAFQLWQCRKVCEYKPTMMAQAWGKVETKENLSLSSKMQLDKKMMSLKDIYRSGQITANQFGGSIVVRFVDDGLPLSEPVNENAINSVSYSQLFETEEIYPDYQAYYRNVYDPEYYRFTYSYGEDKLNGQIIHKDRILRFRGAFLSPCMMRDNQGWEESLITAFLRPLMQYLNANAYVSESVRSFEILDLAIKDLFKKIQEGNEDEIFKRLELNQKMVSSMRGLARDIDEEAQFISRQYRGVAEILEQLRTEMIAASGLTRPQFYQEHPSGLAATGESERQAEANDLMAHQNSKWGEPIKKDLKYNAIAEGIDPKLVDWVWNSLFTPTPIEESDIRNKDAQTEKTIAETLLLVEELPEGKIKNDLRVLLKEKMNNERNQQENN